MGSSLRKAAQLNIYTITIVISKTNKLNKLINKEKYQKHQKTETTIKSKETPVLFCK